MGSAVHKGGLLQDKGSQSVSSLEPENSYLGQLAQTAT